MKNIPNAINVGKSFFNISVFDLLVILYFSHKLLPSVGHYMPGIIYFGIFVLLAVSSVNRTGRIRKLNVLGNMCLLFLGAILECIKYANTGSIMAAPVYLYGEFQILLFGLAVLTYDTFSREHKKKYLFYFIILCFVFTSITTIIGNMKYPMASRLLATDGVDSALYTSQNIGSFTFVYELVLITPLIIYMFKSNRINRFLPLGLVILFGYTIVKTEYTAALLFFALTMVLFFIPKLTNTKIFSTIIIFVILLIFCSTYIADLLRQVGQNLESETVATRFNELSAILSGEEAVAAGNAGNRMELYKTSFNTFVNTSFLGCWSNEGIGGHSFIFDTLGRYGIFGVFTIFVMYKTIYSLFVKPYKSHDFYSYFLYIYLVAVVLAFMNPKTYLFIFITVFPLFANAMEPNEKIKED